MARPQDKILKEGVLKHRQTGIGLQRWRQRHVVFKVTNAGRLQFIIYKEQPCTPDNEIKDIPIEDFGGLDTNLRLDNEKYVFAIITTGSTDCFSTDSPKEMTDWTNLLQEYLGKELVLNIFVPTKQHILKSGKAQLRIRNTGFTITTCDNPPRCQGTWQIIHIRKYGGSDTFRFQTGSKCPTGEYLYAIQTDDNSRVKSLFNDLSQHKPIFTDDRVGRRMTLERSFNSKAHSTTTSGSHQKLSNRFSLQPDQDSPSQHVYQNREAFTQHTRFNSVDAAALTHNQGRRHSAVDGDIFNPHTKSSHPDQLFQKGSPKASHSNEDLTNRLYQNVQKITPSSANSSPSHLGRLSPTKRVHAALVPVPIPEGYYNVTPPQVTLQKYRPSNSTPPSSPDEEGYQQMDEPDMHPQWTDNKEYVEFTPDVGVTLVGDNLVVKNPGGGGGGATSSPRHDLKVPNLNSSLPSGQLGGVYQNLAFMRGNLRRGSSLDETADTRRSTSGDSPQEPVITYEQDWTPHNYTNVDFAKEDVQGRGKIKALAEAKNGIRSRRERQTTPTPATKSLHGKARKISAPSGRHPDGSTSPKSLLSPTRIPLPPSQLRHSHSSQELNKAASQSLSPPAATGTPRNGVENTVEYYNIFVPQLPANTSEQTTQVLGLRNKFENKTVGSATPSLSSEPTHDTIDGALHPEFDDENYSRFNRIDSQPAGDQGNFIHDPNYSTLNEVQSELRVIENHNLRDQSPDVGTSAVAPVSMYDRLEIKSPSKSPCFSPVPMQGDQRGTSPRPPSYDTLTPIENGVDASKPRQVYDSLLPYRDVSSKSSSSSPEPMTVPPYFLNKTYQYNRKVRVLKHSHKYEYIDVDSDESSSNDGARDVTSPTEGVGLTSLEYPSDWVVNRSLNGAVEHTDRDRRTDSITSVQSNRRFSRKSTNSQSRKKHLPLQDKQVDEIQAVNEGSTPKGSPAVAQKPRPPRMSRGSKSRESKSPSSSPKSKPKPLPRKGTGSPSKQNKKKSRDSTELHSSLDSQSSSHRESVLSNDSISSFELIIDSYPTSSLNLPPPSSSRDNGYSRRSMSPPTRSYSLDPANPPPPKIKSIQVEIANGHHTSGGGQAVNSAPPLPPRGVDNSDQTNDAHGPPRVPRRHHSEDNKLDTPPVPLRSKDQRFTVPLPRAEFDFEKPISVTKPKVLLGPEPQKYVSLAFANDRDELSGSSTEYTEVKVNHSRPTVAIVNDTNSSAGDKINYASVDFKRTFGLQATIEQVEDKKRDFLSIDGRR